MKKFKIKYFQFIILFFIIFSTFAIYKINKSFSSRDLTSNSKVIINGKKILVEIADTSDLHYQGLSNRESLRENYGMLFIFKNKQVRNFCMRSMNFPIDILWIDDNKILKITVYAISEGSNPIMNYSSDMHVNYVLEVNGGFCEKNKINIGDNIEFNL